MYRYCATVLRVVDGDTLDLEVDLGFNIFIKVRARLYGIDTPEKYCVKKDSEEYSDGVAASSFVDHWLVTNTTNNRVIIESHDGNVMQQGKHGRWLVTVMYNDPSFTPTLNESLVIEGHAKETTY